MTKQDLREYGFDDNFHHTLRCRKCNLLVPKYRITELLGTQVKYGWCRRYPHGISVCKLVN